MPMPKFATSFRTRKTQAFMNANNPQQDVKIYILGNQGDSYCVFNHHGCKLGYENLPYIGTNDITTGEVIEKTIQQFGKDRIKKIGETNKRNIIKFSPHCGSRNFIFKFFYALEFFEREQLNIESYSYGPCDYISLSSLNSSNYIYNNCEENYHKEFFSRDKGQIERSFYVKKKKRGVKYTFEDTDFCAIEKNPPMLSAVV